MELVNKIAFILVIVGGLNWGLYAFDFNIVSYLGTTLENIVYVLVALSALVLLFAKVGKQGSGDPMSEESVAQEPIGGSNM